MIHRYPGTLKRYAVSPRHTDLPVVRELESLAVTEHCAEAAHSLGFQVDGPDGRLGTVVATLFGSLVESPDALEVRVGLFHRRVVAVPIDAVSRVDLVRKRLILRCGVDLTDGSRVPPPDSG
jgi:hypothetical protein